KLKSHQGAKKRWRALGSGTTFKRGHAFHGHKMANKTPAQNNRLAGTTLATPTQALKLRRQLLPYGT
ncbi:hypothetical protein FISHEDRAFT_31109, partial [Fistulina hepatica ATCC 64428]